MLAHRRICLLFTGETGGLIGSFEVLLNRCAYVFLPEGDELLEVERAGRHLGDRRCVVIRIAGALEGLVFVATGDETCGKLGRLDQVLGELALDHLVLHLLQDGVLSSLQVLDEDFLALLG